MSYLGTQYFEPLVLSVKYVGVVHGQNVKKQTMLFTEKNKTQLVDRTSLIFDKNKKLD